MRGGPGDAERRQRWGRLFEELDSNKDGRVDMHELRQGLARLGAGDPDRGAQQFGCQHPVPSAPAPARASRAGMIARPWSRVHSPELDTPSVELCTARDGLHTPTPRYASPLPSACLQSTPNTCLCQGPSPRGLSSLTWTLLVVASPRAVTQGVPPPTFQMEKQRLMEWGSPSGN